MTYIVKITVTPEGHEGDPLYVNAVSHDGTVGDALDFAAELAQRAADMRETDNWKDSEG